MYTCPHCGNASISIRSAALFKPPFDGRTVCPACGTHLRLKWTVFSFLLPMYLLSRSALGLLFHLRFDLGGAGEIMVLSILAVLQIRCISYREARNTHEAQT